VAGEVRKGLLVEEVRIQVADCWDEVGLCQSSVGKSLREVTVQVWKSVEAADTGRTVHSLADTLVNVWKAQKGSQKPVKSPVDALL